MVYIYGLVCPIAGVIRYVGKSINPEKRLAYHISAAINCTSDHHAARWLRKLANIELMPELVILHHVGPDERWQDVERAFIASAGERGWKLTNSTAGGEGLDYIHQADKDRYLANISAAMKELWNTPERREEARQRSLKSWADPEIAERRIASLRATGATNEFKDKMSAASIEINARADVKAAKSASMKAMWADPDRSVNNRAGLSNADTRTKMSASAKARFEKPGAKAFLSTAQRRQNVANGCKARSTPEYRAMMAEKTRQSWIKRKAK